VTEEETSLGVVWVSVSFRELVVDAVVTCPLVDGVLPSNGASDDEEYFEWRRRFVRTMRPQSMSARCDASFCVPVQEEGPEYGVGEALGDEGEGIEGSGVHHYPDEDVGPDDFHRMFVVLVPDILEGELVQAKFAKLSVIDSLW